MANIDDLPRWLRATLEATLTDASLGGNIPTRGMG